MLQITKIIVLINSYANSILLQYMANVDESPAYLGGKDNTWRRLDLTSKKSYDYMCLIYRMTSHSVHSLYMAEKATCGKPRITIIIVTVRSLIRAVCFHGTSLHGFC